MARKAKVNVNKADRDELAAVPGIGRSTAEAMVKLRFERGGFKRIDELAEVPGIGEQTLEGLRKHVTVSTNGEAHAQPAEKAAAGAEKTATGAEKAAAGAEKSATGAEKSASGVEKGVEATRRTADKSVASAAKVAEAGADVAKKSAAAQAEVSAKQAETADAVRRAAQEQVETAHARQQKTVEVTMSSGNAMLESVREANQAWLGLVQDQIWANVQTAQMLARCRSPQDVLEVQSTYVRSSMERLAEEQARFAELAIRMATRALRPLSR